MFVLAGSASLLATPSAPGSAFGSYGDFPTRSRERPTLAALYAHAETLERRGQLSDAESVLRDLYKTQRAAFGDEHATSLLALAGLVRVLVRSGDEQRVTEAQMLCRDARPSFVRVFGATHPHTRALDASVT